MKSKLIHFSINKSNMHKGLSACALRSICISACAQRANWMCTKGYLLMQKGLAICMCIKSYLHVHKSQSACAQKTFCMCTKGYLHVHKGLSACAQRSICMCTKRAKGLSACAKRAGYLHVTVEGMRMDSTRSSA